LTEYRVTLDEGGISRDFVFIGGPLDSPDGTDDLFAAIGRVAANWARLEQHLDAVLLHLNNPDHSAAIFNAEHPAAFSSKIKHLKRWFNQHPALGGLAEDFRALSSRVKELAKHRNNLLHGTLEKWDAETQTAHFQTMRYVGDDEFTLSRHEYTLEALGGAAELMGSANRFLSSISRAIFTKDALAQLRKP